MLHFLKIHKSYLNESKTIKKFKLCLYFSPLSNGFFCMVSIGWRGNLQFFTHGYRLSGKSLYFLTTLALTGHTGPTNHNLSKMPLQISCLLSFCLSYLLETKLLWKLLKFSKMFKSYWIRFKGGATSKNLVEPAIPN